MILEWVKDHQTLAGWLVALSVLMLLASAVVMPILVSRMRADYFMPDRDRAESLAIQHPVIRWSGLILKNLLGAVLLLAGLVMLLTPGQGLLTVFMGLLLLNFPGKRKLELKLIRQPGVFRAINWIRARAGREPLQLPEADSY